VPIVESFEEVVKGGKGTDIIARIWSSPIWGTILWWFEVLLVVGIIAFAAAYIFKRFAPYSKRLIIFKRLGNGAFEVKVERAAEVTDTDGKRKFKLMKSKKGQRKVTCPVLEDKYRFKMGKADGYMVFQDDNGEIHPIAAEEDRIYTQKAEMILSTFSPMKLPTVDVDNIRLRVRPAERDAWARQEDRALLEKFKKKEAWEKWLPSAVMITTVVFAFLIWFFLSKDLSHGLSALANTFRQVASSCTKLG